MRNLTRSLGALPADSIARHPDVVLAVGVVAILGMLIIPFPTFVVDTLLATNIAVCALILLVSLFARDALMISSFPSILLLTTLFRLALNVSTTRLILAKADAGSVVQGFGNFVVGGDLVVGLVIFGVIAIVQFLVIGKGAERVAEVGARFTLDAMPGQQMSIEAALRAGSIDEDEAEEKRAALQRESKLFGAMDGAMKFVKGDAIAGLIIMALNLVAGMIIGVTRFDMPAADAARVYSILTVGDGLVSQIPALLITLAAGMVTTRVQPQDKKSNLGHSLKLEMFAHPKALGVAALLSAVIGIVPGMPLVPFWGLAVSFGSIGFLVFQKRRVETETRREAFKRNVAEKILQAKAQRSAADEVAPTVVPIGIDLDPCLTEALGFGRGEDPNATELIAELIPQLRDALYGDTGVRFPGVRVRSGVESLPRNTFVIRLLDVPVVQECVPGDKCVAMVPPARLERVGIECTQTLTHPINESVVSVIDPSQRRVVEDCGIMVWSAAGMVALHLAAVLRKHAKEFVGLQEISELVERLRKGYPALVDEVIPKVVTLHQLVDVLRRLVDEGVSIRNLKTIIEALGEFGSHDHDGVVLTERVRASLSLQIANDHAGLSGELCALLLDPLIEETVRDAIAGDANSTYLAMDPEVARQVLYAIARALGPAVENGVRPIILTSAGIRRYVRKLIEPSLPAVAVLSFEELPGSMTIQPMGRATLAESLSSAA